MKKGFAHIGLLILLLALILTVYLVGRRTGFFNRASDFGDVQLTIQNQSLGTVDKNLLGQAIPVFSPGGWDTADWLTQSGVINKLEDITPGMSRLAVAKFFWQRNGGPNNWGVVTYDNNFEGKLTSGELDKFITSLNRIGVKPILMWDVAQHIKPGASNPNDPQEVENKVLNSPELAGLMDMNLDMLSYVKEKGYGVKYWEFGNEPEIWWVDLAPGYNHGYIADPVYGRFKLYGELYSRFAPRARQIDPTIKIGVAIVYSEYYKESIEGFFAGLADGVQPPDWFAPHPYQLRAWGASTCPEGDIRSCINNLLTYQDSSGGASCQGTTIANMPRNIEKINFLTPYVQCVKNLLNQKGISSPILLPTEWEATGSIEMPYQTFGTEVWSADRLGIFAKNGITSAQHWRVGMFNGMLPTSEPQSPYNVFAQYSKFLGNDSPSVLVSSSSDESKASVYGFLSSDKKTLNMVVVNLEASDGIGTVKLNAPSGFDNKAKRVLISCLGANCLYGKNQSRVSAETDINLAERFTIPNHSVMFIKTTIKTEVPPQPLESSNKVVITASGTSVAQIYPHVAVVVDGQKVGETDVNGSLSNYEFNLTNNSPAKIQVQFTNDAYQPPFEDRNLNLAKITVNGTEYLTTGVNVTRQGCGAGGWLWCGGYFEFQLNGQPPPPSQTVCSWKRDDGTAPAAGRVGNCLFKTFENQSCGGEPVGYGNCGPKDKCSNDGTGVCVEIGLPNSRKFSSANLSRSQNSLGGCSYPSYGGEMSLSSSYQFLEWKCN